MSITARCPDCGRQYNVDENLAGTRLQCVECGGYMDLPGMPRGPRICIICQKDVSTIQRTRDPQGNYYCQPCWEGMRKAYDVIPEEIRQEQMSAGELPAPPPRRARKSELARVMAWVNRFHIPWPIKALMPPTIAGLGIATFWYPQVGIITGSALGIPSLFLVIFGIYWGYLLPFRDGWAVGRRYLRDKEFRGQWWQHSRDYPLKRPLLTIWSGIGLTILSVGFFILAELGDRQRREAADLAQRQAMERSEREAQVLEGRGTKAETSTDEKTRESALEPAP